MTDPTTNVSRIDGIVFDIDGVIFDSKSANIGYYNKIREVIGLAPLSKEDEEFCHMASAHQAYERIVPKGMEDIVQKALEEHPYNDFVLPVLTLETGLLESLTWLKELGIKLGICTNRSNAVPDLLRRFGLNSFFTTLKTAYNCNPKPDPQGLLEIVEEWDLSKNQIAFLGDTFADEKAAHRAGVHFWAFKSPNLNADLHFTDYFSFMAIIKPLVEK